MVIEDRRRAIIAGISGVFTVGATLFGDGVGPSLTLRVLIKLYRWAQVGRCVVCLRDCCVRGGVEAPLPEVRDRAEESNPLAPYGHAA